MKQTNSKQVGLGNVFDPNDLAEARKQLENFNVNVPKKHLHKERRKFLHDTIKKFRNELDFSRKNK